MLTFRVQLTSFRSRSERTMAPTAVAVSSVQSSYSFLPSWRLSPEFSTAKLHQEL